RTTAAVIASGVSNSATRPASISTFIVAPPARSGSALQLRWVFVTRCRARRLRLRLARGSRFSSPPLAGSWMRLLVLAMDHLVLHLLHLRARNERHEAEEQQE